MDLSELFTSVIEEKTNEIFSKYKDLINLASPDAKEKAIKHYLSILMKEKQDLFSQKIDPKDEYHYVEAFINNFYQTQKGLFNSFEKEFALAKQNMLEAFNGHGYLPKIKIFLKQSDEEIIKKLALYFAYENAIGKIRDLLIKPEAENIKTKRKKQKQFETNDPEQINQLYSSIFTSPEHLFAVSDIIKKLFDDYGIWSGVKGKKQEVPALVHVLVDIGFIKESKFYATQVFCLKHKIKMSLETMRKKGLAYANAYNYFDKGFSIFLKKSDLYSGKKT